MLLAHGPVLLLAVWAVLWLAAICGVAALLCIPLRKLDAQVLWTWVGLFAWATAVGSMFLIALPRWTGDWGRDLVELVKGVSLGLGLFVLPSIVSAVWLVVAARRRFVRRNRPVA